MTFLEKFLSRKMSLILCNFLSVTATAKSSLGPNLFLRNSPIKNKRLFTSHYLFISLAIDRIVKSSVTPSEKVRHEFHSLTRVFLLVTQINFNGLLQFRLAAQGKFNKNICKHVVKFGSLTFNFCKIKILDHFSKCT